MARILYATWTIIELHELEVTVEFRLISVLLHKFR